MRLSFTLFLLALLFFCCVCFYVGFFLGLLNLSYGCVLVVKLRAGCVCGELVCPYVVV